MAELEPYKNGYYLWKYVPSVAAAAVFCAVFFIAATAHVWRTWKRRAWFCIPFVIGGYMQSIGYAFRAAAHGSTDDLILFAMQQIAILLAPILLAVSICMALGQLIRNVHGDNHWIMSVNWVTGTIILGNTVSLVLQASATGITITGENTKPGQSMVIAGLGFQIFMFGLFLLTAVLFHHKMLHDPRAGSVPESLKWKRDLWILHGLSVLVIARSAFRIAEFASGTDGFLASHEWPLYVFDSVPMLAVMVAFWICMPAMKKRPDSWVSLASATLALRRIPTAEVLEEARPGKR
ncbi:RTA1 like protein-domain-containing protein [Ilyonectria sp. MPI-CAGE-AT-0026]|nr:RTA1 like protein-domain-containing protein [Ilyonectria sp. MPI-CAGE-AT-0026]